MDWDNIRQIDIYNTADILHAQFNILGNSGAISFYTRDEKTPERILYAPNNIWVEGLYRARSFELQNFNNRELGQSKIPNFRPLCFWDPAISLKGNQASKISFPASDQAGVYVIRIQGMINKTQPVYTELMYEVKMEN